MREYQIKMEPFQFIALRKLEIRNSVNEHTKTGGVLVQYRETDWYCMQGIPKYTGAR